MGEPLGILPAPGIRLPLCLSAQSYICDRESLTHESVSLAYGRFKPGFVSRQRLAEDLLEMTIVVADPDERFRDKLKRQLEKITGVTVVGLSSDVDETTAMIHNRKPDVAIINSLLRDGSGVAVLRHIKQLMVPPTIIAVTEDSSTRNKEACYIAGADFFFEKGAEDRKIVNTVRLLCGPQNHTEGADAHLGAPDE